MKTYRMVYECRNCGKRVTVELRFGETASTWPSSVRRSDGKYLECLYCGRGSFSLVGPPKQETEDENVHELPHTAKAAAKWPSEIELMGCMSMKGPGWFRIDTSLTITNAPVFLTDRRITRAQREYRKRLLHNWMYEGTE